MCEGDTLTLSIAQTSYPIIWIDGTNGNSLDVTVSGDYWATVQDGECISSDTISVYFQALDQIDFGSDTTVCYESYLLDALNPGYSYQWQDGSSAQTLLVTEPGTYSVTVTLEDCSSNDTIMIDFEPLQLLQIEGNSSLCNNSSQILSIDGSWQSILWNTGDTSNEIEVDTAGVYWVTAVDICGTRSDTIILTSGLCNCSLYLPYVINTGTLGVNEVNTTRFTCPVTDFVLKIYDPIGRLLSETTDIEWQWEPNTNIAFGVYVFSIRYRFEHESEMRYLTQKVLVAERIGN